MTFQPAGWKISNNCFDKGSSLSVTITNSQVLDRTTSEADILIHLAAVVGPADRRGSSEHNRHEHHGDGSGAGNRQPLPL
jgi:hypothetical protein